MATYTNPQQNQSLSNGDVLNYTATESVKSIILPPGEYVFECWGARGGDMFQSDGNSNWNGKGGYGGYTKGTLKLPSKTTVYIYVGSRGKGYCEPGWINNHLGGWNGGGNCGNLGSSGGGGASDIRLVGGNWNNISSLRSRIMVAAGGGGSNDWANGGAGGGLTGDSGRDTDNTYIATGGTQTSGGTGNCKNGGFGTGGGVDTVNVDGGGGGSGYYGGGQPSHNRASGAGGSSFISGYTGCNAIDKNGNHTNQSVHYSGLSFVNASMITGACNDNGSVKITVITVSNVEILCKNSSGVWGWRNENSLKGYTKLTKNSSGEVVSEAPVSLDLSYTGEPKPITLLPGSYKIECWGASGGWGTDRPPTNIYGKGGYVSGIINLATETVLWIYIGRKGSDYDQADFTEASFNGGGFYTAAFNNGHSGGGGGGATDVRLVGGNWDDINSLRSRIMVAGGGGGGQSICGGDNSPAGHGGGLIGGTSLNKSSTMYVDSSAYGGSQTAGGSGFQHHGWWVHGGLFGKGANSDSCGAGGGGGYYGGGAAYTAGGAGGSSFISGHNGCNAIDKNGNHTNQSVHYSGYMFSDTTMTQGVKDGDGAIKITLIEPYIFGTYLVRINGKIGWRYTPPIVTVTWDPGGGSSTTTSTTITAGEKIGSLPSAYRNGYGFLGWFTQPTGGTKVTENTVIDGYTTFYAHWASSPTNLVITRTPNTNTITKGTTVTITGSATDPLYSANELTYAWEGRISQSSNAYPLGVNVILMRVSNPAGATSLASNSFYVYDPGTPGSTSGGWNGGGSYGPSGSSGGGGGASDIRLGGTTLNHRIIVAGGGGGAGNGNTRVLANIGAPGGGLIADKGTATTAATQSAGGTSPNGNGTLGIGGSHNADGGGGGGGYYGGGAATGDYGGGAGSSYVSPELTDTVIEVGVNDNHGKIKITDPSGSVTDYAKTNTVQVYVCTMDGKYRLECWAGKGGNDAMAVVDGISYGRGGNGGYTAGSIQLKANDILFVYVGGMGGTNGTAID